MQKFIKKRNGEIVLFKETKILEAIRKACEATGEVDVTIGDLKRLTDIVVGKLAENEVPNVEKVQDLVEETLIEEGRAKAAKAYILYRAEHAKTRQTEADLMQVFNDLTFSAAADTDIKRENANIDADTAMGTMLKYGSESAKYFVDHYILPKDIYEAHRNGDIHIHDKDFYLLTETCCQIDLLKLFKNGFSTGHGFLREPNGISSYAALACIAIQANQNEQHGGQSVPNFDYSLAPGVAKTFVKEYKKALARYLQYKLGFLRNDAKTYADEIAASLSPYVTIGDRDKCLDKFKALLDTGAFPTDINAENGAEMISSVYETALEETDIITFQAMEGVIHNLNTMHSRAGAQVPFSSINYGTDTSPEGRMVMKNLLLATDCGLGNGETPIFPVQIFKVKEGVSYNPEDPNYDLFKLACKVSAKRLFPNFSFIDAPFNIPYYKEGDYNTEVAYMGCRTRVIGNTYDPDREVICGRGNLSFTSINLPRIAIESNGDMGKFYAMLDDRIGICVRQLLHRFGIQCQKKVRNYPFLMGQGVWIDSETLDIDDSVSEILKHGTLSIGFIGLAETLKALTGKHHGESEESQKLGLEIISYMRKRMDDESREKGLNFSLLATPAEGLSGRFVRMDKQKYGVIDGVTDHDFYTNSFHVPVYFPLLAYKKIQLEAPYHALANAGHISYVELDGDVTQNVEAFESVIRCMKEAGIGYGSVNHPVDRDPVCGYTGVIGEVCPRCGRREGEAVDVEILRELRKKYPHMPHFVGLD
ncbi:MAG: anaerobic ribonucleoside triphosphate reductase [Oscillospiraceae bacterium]|jgi:ribonucleoside-triphosphate reductase|nr:anaerobic ribonucleoside triphosphate reductase [Oscillospiraceae bacterium]